MAKPKKHGYKTTDAAEFIGFTHEVISEFIVNNLTIEIDRCGRYDNDEIGITVKLVLDGKIISKASI